MQNDVIKTVHIGGLHILHAYILKKIFVEHVTKSHSLKNNLRLWSCGNGGACGHVYSICINVFKFLFAAILLHCPQCSFPKPSLWLQALSQSPIHHSHCCFWHFIAVSFLTPLGPSASVPRISAISIYPLPPLLRKQIPKHILVYTYKHTEMTKLMSV